MERAACFGTSVANGDPPGRRRPRARRDVERARSLVWPCWPHAIRPCENAGDERGLIRAPFRRPVGESNGLRGLVGRRRRGQHEAQKQHRCFDYEPSHGEPSQRHAPRSKHHSILSNPGQLGRVRRPNRHGIGGCRSNQRRRSRKRDSHEKVPSRSKGPPHGWFATDTDLSSISAMYICWINGPG